VKIREATEHDVMQIKSLVASLAHFYMNDNTTELPAWFQGTLTESEFLKRVFSDVYSNYIYESQGEIVGYISMKETSHLYHLFVSEAHHGKGVSRCLWEHAKKECVSEKYTLRSSLYAVPIYRKFGFIEAGPAGVKDGIGFLPMELSQ